MDIGEISDSGEITSRLHSNGRYPKGNPCKVIKETNLEEYLDEYKLDGINPLIGVGYNYYYLISTD